MVYPSKTHFKLKSREVSFDHDAFPNWPIVLNFCTEHGSDTAVLGTKFQKDWTTKRDIIDKPDFAGIQLNSLAPGRS